MENIQILTFNENLYIVVNPADSEFNPYIMKGGSLYDVVYFRPINPKPKQKCLPESFRQQATALIDLARPKWDAIQEDKKKAALTPAQPAPEAPAQPQTQTPQTTLDSLIAKSVAELSVNSVMETAKPMLDKFIADTYGILPKVIEVKTTFGKHEVKGMVCQEFDTALQLVHANIPVFLSGPAGCGKNVMCKQIAEAMGLEFFFSNAVTQEYKITGFIDANGKYQETQFYKAFTEGGVFMLDEIDASTPEVLVLLNAAIANHYFDFPTGRFEAHENFRIIAAGNTYGTGADAEYTGRFQLDASSLDRFAILDVTYDKNIEKAIANENTELLSFIWDFRKAVKKAGINFTVSYRAIERLSKMLAIFDMPKAIKLAILRGMENEDAKLVLNNMKTQNSAFTNALKSIVC